MLTRFLSYILAIIMTIFPFFPNRQTMNNEKVAKAVIYAVENKDASAMEEVMCKNIKDNYNDLTGEINKMLSYIEGDVENITWKRSGGYSESDGKGNSISQNYQDYDIFTTKGVYGISIVIETHNTFSPEELGIRSISLFTLIKNPNPDSSREYVFGESLCKISATEGIQDWHD